MDKQFQIFVLFLLCGMAMMLGLWLLSGAKYIPDRTHKIFSWYQSHPVIQWLDTSIDIERIYYRRHRVFGVFIAVSSLWTLWQTIRISRQQEYLLAMFSTSWPASVIEILVDSGFIFLLLTASLTFSVGLMVYSRPSLLRQIEKKANSHIFKINRTENHGEVTDSLAVQRLVGTAVSLLAMVAIIGLITSLLT